MEVRVYIDGFNLYFGGRRLSPFRTGWKWLDLRGLVTEIAVREWPGCTVTKIVYCTARVDALTNPGGHRDQDVYLKALKKSGSVDWIEYGRFYSKAKCRPLATKGPKDRPIVVNATEPVLVQSYSGVNVPSAHFMVTVADREEKGTDVNIASHLLIDTLAKAMGAAIVISNDSDLAYPVSEARKRLAVGLVNPRGTPTAGALLKLPSQAVAGQWSGRLSLTTLTEHQLPDPCAGYSKPAGW
jgi:hypothetical protein